MENEVQQSNVVENNVPDSQVSNTPTELPVNTGVLVASEEFSGGASTVSNQEEPQQAGIANSKSIAFPATIVEETNFKYKVGDMVCGIYLAGKVAQLPKSTEVDKLFYTIEIIDQDKRVNGIGAQMHESEIQEGTVPQFVTEYQNAHKQDIKDKSREATFGELCVGLNPDMSGIDSLAAVWNIKQHCAQLIDELQFQLRKNQREIAIASMNPTYKLAANVAVVDMQKESINDIVFLKSRLVSAALGNNEKC